MLLHNHSTKRHTGSIILLGYTEPHLQKSHEHGNGSGSSKSCLRKKLHWTTGAALSHSRLSLDRLAVCGLSSTFVVRILGGVFRHGLFWALDRHDEMLLLKVRLPLFPLQQHQQQSSVAGGLRNVRCELWGGELMVSKPTPLGPHPLGAKCPNLPYRAILDIVLRANTPAQTRNMPHLLHPVPRVPSGSHRQRRNGAFWGLPRNELYRLRFMGTRASLTVPCSCWNQWLSNV